MGRFDPSILAEEVRELTSLLRNEKSWSDLRLALQKKGYAAEGVVLAGFVEDEAGNEYGVIITTDSQVFEYQRNTLRRPHNFIKWSAVADPMQLANVFPAVEIGLELVQKRQTL